MTFHVLSYAEIHAIEVLKLRYFSVL